MCQTCQRGGRVSGSRFHSKGYGGIMESVGRGAAAFTGFVAGEALTNKAFKDQKEKNQGIIGIGKVVSSHLVAPMLLPDSIMENNYVQAGLDGFGVSGIKDILLANAASFASDLGISGIDYGYPAYTTMQRGGGNTGGKDAAGNKVRADLQ